MHRTIARRAPRPALAILAAFLFVHCGGVARASSPTITGVQFSGSSSSPTITITGTGFGISAPAASAPPTGRKLCDIKNPFGSNYIGGFTGSDYGTQATKPLHFSYFNLSIPGIVVNGGTGGTSPDCLGLLNLSYADTQISYKFGSFYSTVIALQSGYSFTVTVLGATCSGTVSYTVATTCGGVPPTGGATPEAPSAVLFGAGTVALLAVGRAVRRRRTA